MQQVGLANAIIHQRAELVEQAISMGADVNALDEYGFTPLIEAAIVNDLAITKSLIEAGAKADGEDMVGSTALHWAVQNNNLDLARLLLKHGADANAFTQSSEMPYVKAILSDYKEMAALLLKNGADETFARDYINLKLLGHRYALRGYVDILTPRGTVTEVNLEGFVPEFSLGVILKSLREYTVSYAAKHNAEYFSEFSDICDMLNDALQLLLMKDYLGNPDHKQQQQIRAILSQNRLVLPITSEGHLLMLIRFDDLLVICDRRRDERVINGIRVFRMHNPAAFNYQLCNFLLYEKKEISYIYEQLPNILKLQLVSRIMIEPQMTGNCSWANAEATIPVLLQLLHHDNLPEVTDCDSLAIKLLRQWGEWDRKRALHFFTSSFDGAPDGRRAMIASLALMIVFQRCNVKNQDDVQLALELAPIFMQPEFQYLIDSYTATYLQRVKTAAGENFQQIIDLCKIR